MYSFSQQVFVDVYEVCDTLLCGRYMVLNINDFIRWLRRGKSSPLQGTHRRCDPQGWSLESVRQSRVYRADEAQGNGKLDLPFPWELSD